MMTVVTAATIARPRNVPLGAILQDMMKMKLDLGNFGKLSVRLV
jgi:hypothetical protein